MAAAAMAPALAVTVFLAAAAAAMGLLPSAAAQTVDSCAGDLPAVLAGNYSGLACRPVWNTFVLRYAQGSDNVLRVVVSTLYTTGWVAMGFSPDGSMVGSSAIVGWIGKTGVDHVKQFALKAQKPAGVVANEGQLLTTNTGPVVVLDQAKLYLAFQLQFSRPLKQQHILFAFGNAIPVNNRLTIHEDKTSMNFDFTTGGFTMAAGSPADNLRNTHGGLNIFAWGVLLPAGAMIARHCREKDPLWFYLHVGFQFVGFLLGLAGVIAGFALYNTIHPDIPAHRGLGIFILVLAILQIIAFFWKPSKDAKIRRYWNWYHHWTGRLLLFFAAVNIVVGIRAAGEGYSWRVGYGICLTVVVVTAIVLEVLLWRRRSRKQPPAPPAVFSPST